MSVVSEDSARRERRISAFAPCEGEAPQACVPGLPPTEASHREAGVCLWSTNAGVLAVGALLLLASAAGFVRESCSLCARTHSCCRAPACMLAGGLSSLQPSERSLGFCVTRLGVSAYPLSVHHASITPEPVPSTLNISSNFKTISFGAEGIILQPLVPFSMHLWCISSLRQTFGCYPLWSK